MKGYSRYDASRHEGSVVAYDTRMARRSRSPPVRSEQRHLRDDRNRDLSRATRPRGYHGYQEDLRCRSEQYGREYQRPHVITMTYPHRRDSRSRSPCRPRHLSQSPPYYRERYRRGMYSPERVHEDEHAYGRSYNPEHDRNYNRSRYRDVDRVYDRMHSPRHDRSDEHIRHRDKRAYDRVYSPRNDRRFQPRFQPLTLGSVSASIPPHPPTPSLHPSMNQQPQDLLRRTGIWLRPNQIQGHPAPLPIDRNKIHCENCKRCHDPRLCRGPLKGGRIHVCVRCGKKGHLFENCWWGDTKVDDRDFYLFYPRQGLAPVATRVGCEDLVAQPGIHIKPVLTREYAQHLYSQEKAVKQGTGIPYDHQAINYKALNEPYIEALRLNQDPYLIGYNRGPAPSLTLEDSHYDSDELVRAAIPVIIQRDSPFSYVMAGRRATAGNRDSSTRDVKRQRNPTNIKPENSSYSLANAKREDPNSRPVNTKRENPVKVKKESSH